MVDSVEQKRALTPFAQRDDYPRAGKKQADAFFQVSEHDWNEHCPSKAGDCTAGAQNLFNLLYSGDKGGIKQ